MRDDQIERAIGELRGASSVHKVLTAALDDVEAQFVAGVQQATGCAAAATGGVQEVRRGGCGGAGLVTLPHGAPR